MPPRPSPGSPPGPSLVALIRSATSHEAAATTLRGFLERELVPRLASVVSGPDASLRAALAGSALAGLIVARYVLRIEPVASAEREQLVGSVGPSVPRYLTA